MTPHRPPAAPAAPHAPFPVMGPTMGVDGPDVLRDLSAAMKVALDAVRVARRAPATQLELMAARREYLATIVAYQQALTLFRLPIPHKLRDEARLLRRLVPDAAPAARPATAPRSARGAH